MGDLSFRVTETTDGLLHVQNVVKGHDGQHHVHGKGGFKKWQRECAKEIAISITQGDCACGLAAGQVKEIDGRIWNNPHFEEVPDEVVAKAQPSIGEQKQDEKGKVKPEKPKEAKEPRKEGELVTYSATAKVDGKPVTHQFQHKKGSPWAVKNFAAQKFFSAVVKDKKPLEVWKLIDLKPVAEPKAKKEAAKK